MSFLWYMKVNGSNSICSVFISWNSNNAETKKKTFHFPICLTLLTQYFAIWIKKIKTIFFLFFQTEIVSVFYFDFLQIGKISDILPMILSIILVSFRMNFLFNIPKSLQNSIHLHWNQVIISSNNLIFIIPKCLLSPLIQYENGLLNFKNPSPCQTPKLNWNFFFFSLQCANEVEIALKWRELSVRKIQSLVSKQVTVSIR